MTGLKQNFAIMSISLFRFGISLFFLLLTETSVCSVAHRKVSKFFSNASHQKKFEKTNSVGLLNDWKFPFLTQCSVVIKQNSVCAASRKHVDQSLRNFTLLLRLDIV